MTLLFQDKELLELMEDCHLLTGMKIVLFDENYTELAAYPASETSFCACMRKAPEFDKKCRLSDRISFDRCRESKSLSVYKCHAGLTEATAPILENGRIIGYLLFGQVTDNKNKQEFFEEMTELCRRYAISEDLSDKIKKIKYRNMHQIRAASKVLDACTGYLQLKGMVSLSGRQSIRPIEEFIDAHLSEDLSVSRLSRELGISRTRLYEMTKPYFDGGIASLIRHKRLEKAKTLLKTRDMTVAEIAETVGFSDYNYFLRSFKAKYGLSPKKMQQK